MPWSGIWHAYPTYSLRLRMLRQGLHARPCLRAQKRWIRHACCRQACLTCQCLSCDILLLGYVTHARELKAVKELAG